VTDVTTVTRRGFVGCALGALSAGLVAVAMPSSGASAGPTATAALEVYPIPPGGQFTVHGRGFGHGHGMSQWGAFGAAQVKHLSGRQIVRFYYPHTRLVATTGDRHIRVDLSAADSVDTRALQVGPAAGLALSYGGSSHPLPLRRRHHRIKGWQLTRASTTTLRLRAFSQRRWHRMAVVGAAASFHDPASQIPVVLPGGTTRAYRGSVRAVLVSGVVETVNAVRVSKYLLSVVPQEMPASWATTALRAQAIAARTYAEHAMAHPHASWFDIYGDTRDQAYGGVAAESATTTAAVKRTAGEVLETPGGSAILAQFGAADGGWTASGGVSYLPARRDPFDGLIASSAHAWTTTIPAAAVQSLAPSIGTLRDLEVTQRDGNGRWGGRVTGIRLLGSAGSAAVDPTTFEFGLGLRSTWWRPTPTPAAPRRLAATAAGRSVTLTWAPPKSVKGAAAVTGYRVTFAPSGKHRTVDASTNTVTVRHLTKGTTYHVTVVARSDAGSGPGATVSVTPRRSPGAAAGLPAASVGGLGREGAGPGASVVGEAGTEHVVQDGIGLRRECRDRPDRHLHRHGQALPVMLRDLDRPLRELLGGALDVAVHTQQRQLGVEADQRSFVSLGASGGRAFQTQQGHQQGAAPMAVGERQRREQHPASQVLLVGELERSGDRELTGVPRQPLPGGVAAVVVHRAGNGGERPVGALRLGREPPAGQDRDVLHQAGALLRPPVLAGGQHRHAGGGVTPGWSGQDPWHGHGDLASSDRCGRSTAPGAAGQQFRLSRA
jgi:stage II sporulation protein D